MFQTSIVNLILMLLLSAPAFAATVASPVSSLEASHSALHCQYTLTSSRTGALLEQLRSLHNDDSREGRVFVDQQQTVYISPALSNNRQRSYLTVIRNKNISQIEIKDAVQTQTFFEAYNKKVFYAYIDGQNDVIIIDTSSGQVIFQSINNIFETQIGSKNLSNLVLTEKKLKTYSDHVADLGYSDEAPSYSRNHLVVRYDEESSKGPMRIETEVSFDSKSGLSASVVLQKVNLINEEEKLEGQIPVEFGKTPEQDSEIIDGPHGKILVKLARDKNAEAKAQWKLLFFDQAAEVFSEITAPTALQVSQLFAAQRRFSGLSSRVQQNFREIPGNRATVADRKNLPLRYVETAHGPFAVVRDFQTQSHRHWVALFDIKNGRAFEYGVSLLPGESLVAGDFVNTPQGQFYITYSRASSNRQITNIFVCDLARGEKNPQVFKTVINDPMRSVHSNQGLFSKAEYLATHWDFQQGGQLLSYLLTESEGQPHIISVELNHKAREEQLAFTERLGDLPQ